MRRGVKGTITSLAKVRNSANHLRAVDCCISSSMQEGFSLLSRISLRPAYVRHPVVESEFR